MRNQILLELMFNMICNYWIFTCNTNKSSITCTNMYKVYYNIILWLCILFVFFQMISHGNICFAWLSKCHPLYMNLPAVWALKWFTISLEDENCGVWDKAGETGRQIRPLWFRCWYTSHIFFLGKRSFLFNKLIWWWQIH